MAVHDFQYFVRTGLQGDMEMRGKVTALGDKVNDFVAQQIGFAGRYTDTEITIYVIQCPQKVDKPFVGGAAEIANVYTGKDNFAPSCNAFWASSTTSKINGLRERPRAIGMVQ